MLLAIFYINHFKVCYLHVSVSKVLNCILWLSYAFVQSKVLAKLHLSKYSKPPENIKPCQPDLLITFDHRPCRKQRGRLGCDKVTALYLHTQIWNSEKFTVESKANMIIVTKMVQLKWEQNNCHLSTHARVGKAGDSLSTVPLCF